MDTNKIGIKTYPSSFDKTLRYAVNKRMAKVEDSTFIKSTKFIKKRTSFQVAAAIHLNYTKQTLSILLSMKHPNTDTEK